MSRIIIGLVAVSVFISVLSTEARAESKESNEPLKKVFTHVIFVEVDAPNAIMSLPYIVTKDDSGTTSCVKQIGKLLVDPAAHPSGFGAAIISDGSLIKLGPYVLVLKKGRVFERKDGQDLELNKDSKVQVVASPMIVIQSGCSANLTISDKVPYIAGVIHTRKDKTPVIKYIDVGYSFDLTPEVVGEKAVLLRDLKIRKNQIYPQPDAEKVPPDEILSVDTAIENALSPIIIGAQETIVIQLSKLEEASRPTFVFLTSKLRTPQMEPKFRNKQKNGD